MHISYLIIGINICFKKLFGKKTIQIVTICVLIVYSCIIGFSASTVRAVIMAVMIIISKLIYRKSDIYTSIAISLFVILIYNPYSILQIGIQLSYGGTLGILLFSKNMNNIIKCKNEKIKKIKEIVVVMCSAQIVILPIMLFHFNILGLYFIITNILVSFIIGLIVILGFIFCITAFVSNTSAKVISIFLKIGVKILIQISKFSNLPFSKIYIPTIKIWKIIIYFAIILVLNFLYTLYQKNDLNMTQRRIKNLIALFKYKMKNVKKLGVIICIILICIIKILPQNLKVHFIDVGQGDATLIVTPKNKTILIDGGGSSSSNFDVGKQILLPYILDRGFSKIDYVFISHFDYDHIGRNFVFIERNKSKKCHNR